MSKGFGKTELEILSTLDESRAFSHYRGGMNWTEEHKCFTEKAHQPGWIYFNGVNVRLAPEVYDLHAVARIVANRRGLVVITGSFQASFSRAVKSLIRKGALVAKPAIPLTAVNHVSDRNRLIGREEHGAKRRTLKAEKQIRFVESGFTSYVRPQERWDKPYLPNADQRMRDYYLNRLNDPDERRHIEKRLRRIEDEKREILLDLKIRRVRQP